MNGSILIRTGLLAAGLAAGPAGAQTGDADHSHSSAPVATVPLYDNLGSHHFAVTVGEAGAQEYFDQGMRLYYAFNHAESIRSFEEALRIDPGCAMCAWGIALALGPNINAAMDPAAVPLAMEMIARAERSAGAVTPLERELIGAQSIRYRNPAPEDRSQLDQAYSVEMGRVAAAFPESREASVLYAESIMDLSPWNYWTADGEPREGTTEALDHLEAVLAANPEHPGACHFFIHAVEAIQPERAVPCAERLADLMPGAGHIVHMPGHIYIRVGRYHDAIVANEHAVHADESYIRDQNPALGNYTAGYYPHNYDFLAFAAAMVGRSALAGDAADQVAALVPDGMLHSGALPFLQQFVMRPIQQDVRFGRWSEILGSTAPDASLPHARALWHYSHGVALAATGDRSGALADLAAVRAAATGSELDGVHLEFNAAQAILSIAAKALEARIATEGGDLTKAAGLLEEAVALEAALTYGEPPEWLVPTRQELGTVLLEAGRAAEAEAVFRQDLGRHPANGWSLLGLTLSLDAQGRAAEAAAASAEFEAAWSQADVTIESPRF